MGEATDLKRFQDAQRDNYERALAEIKNGRKQTHWIWYIFPQIKGLGFSETSRYYAIKDLTEAEAFLKDPVLGSRLINICQALLVLKQDNANAIFGSPDDLKLKSCMTLFASLQDTDPVFQLLLDKFFDGQKDMKTLGMIATS